MKKLWFFLIISFYLSVFQQTASAAIIQVPDDYSTLREAICAAQDGDEVIVSPGTYFETNVHFNRKAITVRSINPNNRLIVESTIIDGSRGEVSVFNLYMGEGPDSVLTGFTIRNSHSGESILWGGGISCHQSSPTISNNIIENNSAKHGGGIACYQSEAVIINNTIRNNYASISGGGIIYIDSTGEITGNTITGNQSMYGGGLSLGNNEGFDSPLIDGNVINLNRSDHGAGIACYGVVITNNIIMHNIGEKPTSSCGVVMGGGIYDQGRSVIRGNTVSNNTAEWGGGIHLTGCTSEISDNIISDNFATLHGGGLDSRLSSESVVKKNTILNNRSTLGAGIFCYSGTFVNNVISGNEGFSEAPESMTYGGGIYFADISGSNVSQPNLTNNTLDRNTADQGGNVYICRSSPVIKNNIISNALSGGGIFGDSGESFQPVISYCNLFQNQGNNYVGINDLTGSSGNISENPLFANDENSDYHLRSAYGRWTGLSWAKDIQTSPCIDMGDPLFDYFRESSPNGGRINMGAYGDTVEASRSYSSRLSVLVYEFYTFVYPLLEKAYPYTMTVHLANDSKQLMKIIEKEIIHVLLIDISFSNKEKLNTAKLISKLKTVSKYKDIAIIGYSKKNIKGEIDLYRKAGLDKYVSSPNTEKLIKAINSSIKKEDILLRRPYYKEFDSTISKSKNRKSGR